MRNVYLIKKIFEKPGNQFPNHRNSFYAYVTLLSNTDLNLFNETGGGISNGKTHIWIHVLLSACNLSSCVSCATQTDRGGEWTAKVVAPRRFCVYKIWNQELQSIAQYQEAPGDFHLIENRLFLLLSPIRGNYCLQMLPGIRGPRLSYQKLQSSTTKVNIKTKRNNRSGCRKGKCRRYSFTVNVMCWPKPRDWRHTKTRTKCSVFTSCQSIWVQH